MLRVRNGCLHFEPELPAGQRTKPHTEPRKREATEQVYGDGLNEVIAVVDNPSGLTWNTESWVVGDVRE